MTADNIIVHAVDTATGQLSRAEEIPPLLIPMPECLQFVEAPEGVPQPGAELLAVETKVLPAMVTPLMPDGSLDVESVDRVVDDCLGPQRCSGLYINGMTGEGLFLPMALRKEMAERCIQQATGRGHCIVHVAAASTADAYELAQHAGSCGADAISSFPPFLFDQYDFAVRFQQPTGRLPLRRLDCGSVAGRRSSGTTRASRSSPACPSSATTYPSSSPPSRWTNSASSSPCRACSA